MNNRQEEAVDKHSDELMKALRPSLNDSFLPYLEYRKVISAGNRLTIEGKRSDFDKMIILFDFLKVKEKGWQGLIDFLKQEGHPSLAKTLENSAKPVEQSVDRTEISFNSGFVSSPQSNLFIIIRITII